MHRLGLVDKRTMRDFDLRCLTTVEGMSPHDIHALAT
jgi:DNA-binding transcriptional regulator YiaG